MNHDQTTFEKTSGNTLLGIEKSVEEKWVLRLFAVLLACAAATLVVHSIGQVILIAHICT